MPNTSRKNEYGETVVNWLSEYLSFGAMNYHMVKATARTEGFTRGELKAARIELGVKLITPEPGVYLWALPGKEQMADNMQIYR